MERHKFTVLTSFENETFHNIFVTGDWDLEKLTNVFGDVEAILPNVLHRRSCPVEVVRLLIRHGANINSQDQFGQSPLMIAIGMTHDEAVIRELLEAGADINIGETGENLLIHYLGRFFEKNNCDIGLVQLLLSYNVNINAVNASGNSPIMIALQYSRGIEIIQALLEKGAHVDIINRRGKSPLCFAFHYCSSDIVKLLLDAEANPNTCTYHWSAFHCAVDFPFSDLHEDVANFLLKKNIDLNSTNEDGQSLICFALQHGANAHNIQLLMTLGASLNACSLHSSPLICATCSVNSPLRKDVVQVLLDNGASARGTKLKVLQSALHIHNYETGAIELLLDLPGMDDYILNHKTILHVALRGVSCKLDTVNLLINHNVQVDSEDEMKNIPLHLACRHKRDLSIIKLLLINRSPVNVMNNQGETPLMVAVNSQCHVDTLKELLLYNAIIGTNLFRDSKWEKCVLIELLAREWENNVENSNLISKFKMLLKFFLLQNPFLKYEDLRRYLSFTKYETDKLENFSKECLIELSQMDTFVVFHGCTFRMIVKKDMYLEKEFDFNLLIIFLSNNSFSIYFDVISARIDRSFMEAQLPKLRVYTNKIDPIEQVFLCNDIVPKIAKHLGNDDLLKFILAFYVPVQLNKIDRENKDNSFHLGKRKCQAIAEL